MTSCDPRINLTWPKADIIIKNSNINIYSLYIIGFNKNVYRKIWRKVQYSLLTRLNDLWVTPEVRSTIFFLHKKIVQTLPFL